MNTPKKKALKIVARGYALFMLLIGAPIVIFVLIRSGSLSASLTVGLLEALAGLRWVFSDYLKCKREFVDEAKKGES